MEEQGNNTAPPMRVLPPQTSSQQLVELYLRCSRDPAWEALHVSKRPLRGPQAEVIKRVEAFVAKHEGGVMTIRSARQTGKNEIAAVLQRRHLWHHQFSPYRRTWIRTAPTYKPQIVNSKKRLNEMLRIGFSRTIQYPTFNRQRLIQEEGYIYRVGNAAVEFISSGPTANVVGATANECLDMDEAHKVDKAKFDEDFAPFTASTNAATLLWGVASDGLDTIEYYANYNREAGRDDLNIHLPCEVWMEANPAYAAHIEDRTNKLGWDHPIMKTQYRLIPVSAEGAFLQPRQIRSLLSGLHERQRSPRWGSIYHILIDVAASNEEFNPEDQLEGEEQTSTDSTVVWVYEVTRETAENNHFPIIRIVDVHWFTGAMLETQHREIEKIIQHWRAFKVCVDAVGVGRQMAESLKFKFGEPVVNAYVASSTTVSEDCFDLLARLNFDSVKMFQNDGSPEWAEFERQCGWTKYTSDKGKMKLMKPRGDMHIDMVKALTYINRNTPISGQHAIYSNEGDYTA